MYKKLQILFLFIIVFCALCLNASAADILYGDADGDGSITASDAASVLQYTLNGKWTGLIPVEYCDVDADGYISASDATDILQKALVESYVFKAGTTVSSFKILDRKDNVYYTDGHNVSAMERVLTYDGDDIVIKGEEIDANEKFALTETFCLIKDITPFMEKIGAEELEMLSILFQNEMLKSVDDTNSNDNEVQ